MIFWCGFDALFGSGGRGRGNQFICFRYFIGKVGNVHNRIKLSPGKIGWGGNPHDTFERKFLLFVRASGEAILGTQRYFLIDVLITFYAAPAAK